MITRIIKYRNVTAPHRLFTGRPAYLKDAGLEVVSRAPILYLQANRNRRVGVGKICFQTTIDGIGFSDTFTECVFRRFDP
jgi:hypothetical protein